MLGLQRVLHADPLQDFRGEVGQAREADGPGLRQAVAHPQDAVVGDADDIAGESLLGQFAVGGEEHDRRVDRQLAAGVLHLELHAARELARAQAQEGDAVTVVGVHVRLDLEDEAGHLRIARDDVSGVATLGRGHRLGRRGVGAEAGQQLVNAEVAQGRAEEHWGHVALEEGLGVEGFRGLPHQHGGLFQFGALLGVEIAGHRVAGETDRGGVALVLVVGGLLGERQELLVAQVQHPLESPTGTGRPVQRRRIEGQLGGDLVQQLDGVLRLAVHLVDEGDDRDVAQPADLEQLQGLGLDPLGGVQNHDRGVGGRERAVGVFREVLVARGVQQVEHQACVVEGHDAGRDGDPALAFDLHPVRPGPAVLATGPHRAGRADRAARQQQVLGQRRLAGVRVGDDGEGAPARGLGGGRIAHGRGLAQAGPGS